MEMEIKRTDDFGSRFTHEEHHRLTSITECAESKECHSAKHHYDECAARVTGQIEENGKADEDCVEECKLLLTLFRRYSCLHFTVFHLAHCATNCAAPKLFAQLK